jgi:hypothetical protein
VSAVGKRPEPPKLEDFLPDAYEPGLPVVITKRHVRRSRVGMLETARDKARSITLKEGEFIDIGYYPNRHYKWDVAVCKIARVDLEQPIDDTRATAESLAKK